MKKRFSVSDKIFLSVLCSTIVILGVLIFILPQRSFSDKENRPLSRFPNINTESVLNGNYFTELSKFYADQFPMRDYFTSAYSISELALGKNEINNVLITKDKTLVALPKETTYKLLKKNLDFINKRANKQTFLYVPPRSIDYFQNEIPALYNYSQHKEELSCLPEETRKRIDFFCKNKGLFYKTDHHWNTDGAYLAYTQICEMMNIKAYDKDFFKTVIANENFKGTSASKSALPDCMIQPDEIKLYRYNGDSEFLIKNHEKGTWAKGFYDFSALECRDKYKIFMGGNYSHVSIISENEQKEKLLLIKDSFANSAIPFLALHFDIEVIDSRYCKKSFLHEQMKREDIDRTLILMSIDVLAENIFTN